MAKVHLRANKITNGKRAMALCATQRSGKGMVRSNGRATYRFMASEIVGYDEFREVSESDRCAHCMDRGLIVRNRQRREKGLPPVSHLFEVTEAQAAR